MMDTTLQNFISQMRTAGKTDAEISQQLRAAGWGETDISIAISSQSPNPFFRPRQFWDVMVLVPLVYAGIFGMFLSEFALLMIKSFSLPLSSPFEVKSPITAGRQMASLMISFWLMFPVHLVVAAVAVLGLVYVLLNHRRFAATTQERLNWAAIGLLLGPMAIPYVHFRYLRNWTTKKGLILVGGISLVVMSIILMEAVRVTTAISSLNQHIRNFTLD